MIDDFRLEFNKIKKKENKTEKKKSTDKEKENNELLLVTKSVEKLVIMVKEQSDEIKQLKQRIADLESSNNEIKHNVYADSDLNHFMIDESKQSALESVLTKSDIEKGMKIYKKDKKK
jgi:cell division septum initiation protein DivIVA